MKWFAHFNSLVSLMWSHTRSVASGKIEAMRPRAVAVLVACVACLAWVVEANLCQCLCCSDERTCLHTKDVSGCVDCTEGMP